MSVVASPFGLKPVWHPSGIIRQMQCEIASAYATTVYQYSPVLFAASGYLQAAPAAGRLVGAFMGVEYTDSNGRRVVSNKWIASTVATDIIAYYTEDPNIVYEIQADAAITIAGMGQQYEYTALAGNSTTGLSSIALGVSTAAANAALRVIGLNPGPTNGWAENFATLQVQISKHQYVADIASV